MVNKYTTRDEMARTKFDNQHLVSENKGEVVKRIFEVLGSKRSTDLARDMGRESNEVGNWFGKDKTRAIPVEFIVDFCIKHGVSIDYILTGKTLGSNVAISGPPSISFSSGSQQIAGSNFGPGANISNGHPSPNNRPEIKKIIAMLEYYGSPALCDKIERMIKEMYGERDG